MTDLGQVERPEQDNVVSMNMSAAQSASGRPVSESDKRDPSNAIKDKQFIKILEKLRLLRNFIITNNIKDRSIPDKPTRVDINIGKLNELYFREDGRFPTAEEWDLINERTQYLYSVMNEIELKRFNFTRTTDSMLLRRYPSILILLSILSLLIPALAGKSNAIVNYFQAQAFVPFFAFLTWTIVLGSLGSIAFILVNVLGIQVDRTVDTADKDLLQFRMYLGALFALVLSLPFGYPSFSDLIVYVQHTGLLFTGEGATSVSETLDPKKAGLLLMPFLFGFSTSLVLVILNRFVEGVQTFFGVGSAKPS